MGLLDALFGDSEKKKLLDRAEEFFKSDNHESAIEAYEDALAEYPNEFRVLTRLAYLYVKSGVKIPRAKRLLYDAKDFVKSRSDAFYWEMVDVNISINLLRGPASLLETYMRAPSFFDPPEDADITEFSLFLPSDFVTYKALYKFLGNHVKDATKWEWLQAFLPEGLPKDIEENVLFRFWDVSEAMGLEKKRHLLLSNSEMSRMSAGGASPVPPEAYIPAVEISPWDHTFWLAYDQLTEGLYISPKELGNVDQEPIGLGFGPS